MSEEKRTNEHLVLKAADEPQGFDIGQATKDALDDSRYITFKNRNHAVVYVHFVHSNGTSQENFRMYKNESHTIYIGNAGYGYACFRTDYVPSGCVESKYKVYGGGTYYTD